MIDYTRVLLIITNLFFTDMKWIGVTTVANIIIYYREYSVNYRMRTANMLCVLIMVGEYAPSAKLKNIHATALDLAIALLKKTNFVTLLDDMLINYFSSKLFLRPSNNG